MGAADVTATIDGRAFRSALAPHIEGLVRSKRARGYDYSQVAYQLWRLDSFCVATGHAEAAVTAALAESWLEALPGEGGASRASRASAMRQLALHELSLGVDAHLPRSLPSVGRPAVYLPTPEETGALFAAVDAWEDPAGRWWLGRGYRLAFRLMRLCGMRISECAGMALADVDSASGTLLVRRSKGDKDRLVYVSPDMAGALGGWASAMAALGTPWLFPGADPARHVHKATYDVAFSRFWERALRDMGAAPRGKAPTPHSLRHAFVSDRIGSWARDGVPVGQMMPYLEGYLGHVGPDESLYYYHLAEMAAEAVRASGSAVPEAVRHG